MEKKVIQVLIIGSGPAGYTAAIYASRAGLKPTLLTGSDPGGQLTTTNEVENFPGYPQGINGPEMMIDLQKQAERFDTVVEYKTVVGVDFATRPFTVHIEGGEIYKVKSVVIATGASAKYLGIPSEETFANKGVSACAVCDGYFFKGQDVAVVGGGDSAAEEALYLSKLCPKVHLIVRKNTMRASKIMQKRVLESSTIIPHWNTQTDEVLGDDEGVKAVRVMNTRGEEKREIPIRGFFLSIGHQPNTGVFKGHVDMDDHGYIKVRSGSTHTNVEGVFAVGDVADRVYRQAITAAGTGCMGALDAEKYLSSIEK